MSISMVFNPPQFEDEYDGQKMRQLMDELLRLYAEFTRQFDWFLANQEALQWIDDAGQAQDFIRLVGSSTPGPAVGHVVVKSFASQQSTSGTYVDKTGATIAHASLDDNEDYLVYVRATHTNLTSQSTAANGIRVTYDNTVTSWSEKLWEGVIGITNVQAQEYSWCGVISSGTTGDLQIEFKSGNGTDTIDVGYCTLLAIKVSDLTLNTNIFHDEDLILVELDDGNFPPTNYETLGASLTIGDGTSDYLVFGCVEIGDMLSGGNVVQARVRESLGNTFKEACMYQRSDASDEFTRAFTMLYEAQAATTLTIEATCQGFPADAKRSFLAAIRLNAFVEHFTDYDPDPDESGWSFPLEVEVATLAETATVTSANWGFIGAVTDTYAGSGLGEPAFLRLDIDGAGDITIGGDETWKYQCNPTSRRQTRFAVSDNQSISSGETIDADMVYDTPASASTAGCTEALLVGFTWELAGGTECFTIGNTGFPTCMLGTKHTFQNNAPLNWEDALGAGASVELETFTAPVVGDPDIASVVLLAAVENTDGEGDMAFVTDVGGHTLTAAVASGGVAEVRGAQSKFGSFSMFNDDAAGAVSARWGTTVNSTDFDFAAGDYTMECHLLFNRKSSTNIPIFAKWIYNHFSFHWDFNSTSETFNLTHSTNGTGSGGGDSIAWPVDTYVTGQWYHMAAARQGNTIRFFVDGQLCATQQDVTGITYFTGDTEFEVFSQDSNGAGDHATYIDNLRVTKGVARYTAAFTPPTAPYPTGSAVASEFVLGDPLFTMDLDALAIRMRGSTVANYVSFDHDNTDLNIGGVNTTDINIANITALNVAADVEVTGTLSIWDPLGTDRVRIFHDGSSLESIFTNTTAWKISGITSAIWVEDGCDLHVRDSGNIRSYGTGNTAYFTWLHDATDARFLATNTTDVNFTGATGEYQFDNDLLIHLGGRLLVTNPDDTQTFDITWPTGIDVRFEMTDTGDSDQAYVFARATTDILKLSTADGIAGAHSQGPRMNYTQATQSNVAFAGNKNDLNSGLNSGNDAVQLIAGAQIGVQYTEVSNEIVQLNDIHQNVTASVTQTQGQGAILSSYVEVRNIANPNDVVTLPAQGVGKRVLIYNMSDVGTGNNTLQIFPASGHAIDNLAANVSVTLEPGQCAFFVMLNNVSFPKWQRMRFDPDNVAFDDLTDVDLTGAADNDLLYRSGGNWLDTGGLFTFDGTDAQLLNSGAMKFHEVGNGWVGQIAMEADGSIHFDSTSNQTSASYMFSRQTIDLFSMSTAEGFAGEGHASAPSMSYVASTTSSVGFAPNKADPNTGLHGVNDNVQLIAGGQLAFWAKEANSNVFLIWDTQSNVTASVTQTQGQQTVRSSYVHVITVANPDDVITLPAAGSGIGENVWVFNRGANRLQIFATGTDEIDDLGNGVSVTLEPGHSAWFFMYVNNRWTKVLLDTSLDDLTDLDLTGAADDDLLVRAGGEWVDTAGLLTWDETKLRVAGDAVVREPYIQIENTAGVTDEKKWNWGLTSSGATFSFELENDAGNAWANVFTVSRVAMAVSTATWAGLVSFDGGARVNDDIPFLFGNANDMQMEWNTDRTPHQFLYDSTAYDNIMAYTKRIDVRFEGTNDASYASFQHDDTDFSITTAGTTRVDLLGGDSWFFSYGIYPGPAGGLATETGKVGLFTDTFGEGLRTQYPSGHQTHLTGTPDVIFQFDSNTTQQDPGQSDMRYSSATMTSVVSIYYDMNTATGEPAAFWMASLAIGDLITVVAEDNPENLAVFQVDGVPTDNTGWWKVPVVHMYGTTLPAAGEIMVSSVTPVGAVPRRYIASQTASHTTDTVGLSQFWGLNPGCNAATPWWTNDIGTEISLSTLHEFPYRFDALIAAANPSQYNMRFNSGTPASVTELYFNDTQPLAWNNNWLQHLADGDVISIIDEFNRNHYLVCSVNGTPTDNTSWWTIPVTVIHSGTIPLEDDLLKIKITWMSQAGPVTAFGDLSDVDLTGAAQDDLLVLGSTNWQDTGAALTFSGSALFTTANIEVMGHGINMLEGDTRIREDAGVDYLQLSHDGTNAIFTGFQTADLNITGITQLNLGGADIDDVDSIFSINQTAAKADVTGYGQWWAADFAQTSNSPMFTTDGGSDINLSSLHEDPYRYDNTVSMAFPGVGYLRFNNLTPASITTMAIDDTTIIGTDNAWTIDNLAIGDQIVIASETDAADYLVLVVDAAPTDNTTWWTVPVAVLHSGTIFTLDDVVKVSIRKHTQLDTLSLAVFDSSGADSGTLTHDGTDLNLTGVNAALFNITGFGGVLIDGYLQHKTATDAELNAIANAINTAAGKIQGAEVYNSTQDVPVYAVGNADGSVWVDGAGTTVNTPVA